MTLRLPPLPKSLHWLGERPEADATRHALDMTGCVMYFDRQSDCLEFMRWLSNRADEQVAGDFPVSIAKMRQPEERAKNALGRAHLDALSKLRGE